MRAGFAGSEDASETRPRLSGRSSTTMQVKAST
jgi:hypothetical protein